MGGWTVPAECQSKLLFGLHMYMCTNTNTNFKADSWRLVHLPHSFYLLSQGPWQVSKEGPGWSPKTWACSRPQVVCHFILAWCPWDELNSGRVASATPVGCPALGLAQAGGIISWLSEVLMFLCKCSQSKNLKGKKSRDYTPSETKAKCIITPCLLSANLNTVFSQPRLLAKKALPDPLMNRAGGRFNHSIQNRHFGFLLFDFEPWLFFS